MIYTSEELNEKSIHSLRCILRDVGGVPGVLDKRQLIEKIVAIQSGKEKPVRSPRGRKPIENPVYEREKETDDFSNLEFSDIEPGEKRSLTGILEVCAGKYGFLRGLDCSFSKRDAYVLPETVKLLGLKSGDELQAVAEKMKDSAILTVSEVISLNGTLLSERRDCDSIDCMSSRYPIEKFDLDDAPVLKEIDLLCPIGKGQRVLFTADGDGYNQTLKKLVESFVKSDKTLTVATLLSGLKPEEVTEYKDIDGCYHTVTYCGEEYGVTVRKIKLFFERVKTVVENGGDVAVVVNSVNSLVKILDAENENNSAVNDGINYVKSQFSKAGNYGDKGRFTFIAVVKDGEDKRISEDLGEIATSHINLVGCTRGEKIKVDISSFTEREELLLTEEQLASAESLRKG